MQARYSTRADAARVTQLETEYLRAITAAELSWLSGLADDRRTGALSSRYEELATRVKSWLPE